MHGLKTHRITEGDSLQKLARLYDIEDWRQITILNSLEEPYIDSVFFSDTYKDNPKVAKIGDIILLPKPNGDDINISNRRNEEIESLAYGIDIDINGDLPVATTIQGEIREGGDIKLVAGVNNLAQQLNTRLTTKRGSLIEHPDYGSDLYKYNGLLDNGRTDNKVIFEVESCIREDFRVKDVTNIKLIHKGSARYVSCTVIPIEPGTPFKYEYILL
ncbi:DUF2634 domain-containing protein [Peptoniphilus sp. MSJ-1]|uniref:DUF2634 domain-containing protein n=1 Tax=Peptoniphilus ovalis TaxID=2841503 RepID=A0ABS6FH51_9FIRM|nr:DUF2634 domain-containing protein [Peptoniphilus ovalis]MBU5669502.1 DUF2634 domain-containing protein [Peptoniphilus ovalis]